MAKTLLIICVSVFALEGLTVSQVEKSQPDQLFVVIQNDKRGYIDRMGRIVITPQFGGANNFSEGLAVVAFYEGAYKEGYINTTGQIAIKPRFDAASDFSEGLAAVGFDTKRTQRGCSHCDPNQHWGYIDKTGRIVVKAQFHNAGEFSEGLAAVERDDRKWIYLDKSGRIPFKANFDFASRFSEGLAGVVFGKLGGYIKRDGKIVIGPRFASISDFSEGLARVRIGGKTIPQLGMSEKPGGTWAYINRQGTVVIKLQAESADDFSDGLAAFEIKKSDGYLYCGYVDKSGAPAIPPQFGDCGKFSDGLAAVLLDGKWHYIDRAGKIVISVPFFLVKGFHNGLAWVTEGKEVSSEKYGYIDKTGKTVWNPSR